MRHEVGSMRSDGLVCAVFLRFMEWQFTLDNIKDTARQLWQHANGRTVLAFYGQMGAGKTTFIHALCDEKKVQSTVGSPTFSIINQYNSPQGMLYHIDLYRLKDEEEAVRAGVEDCLYSGDTCLVEWPERAEGIFPEDTLKLQVRVVDRDTRIISIVE
jgi:tRNA threonylcarbamoyladenosine biosynthesis protein TsaE